MSGYEIIPGKGKPIKAWVNGVPVEEQAKTQLRNISELPIVSGHIAVMPDVHLGKGATVGSVIPTKNAIIPSAVGVDIGCFHGDTKIPLLNGTQKKISDLVGHDFWVYSCTKDGQVVPGRAKAVLTRRNAELCRVVVSGGDEIICTPDHQFMMIDGSYREARDLKFNQSLMPLYRRWQRRDGYESCSAGNGRWHQTHDLVHRYFFGVLPEGNVIHHKNINHFDNSPENLVSMTASAHSALHRSIGRKFNNSDPEFQRRRRIGMSRRRADPEKLAQMVAVGTRNISKYMTENPDHFTQSVAGNGKRGAPYLTAFNTSPRKCKSCDFVAKNPGELRWHNKREHETEETRNNHKVISVEMLDERADVFCLQVEKHHNFALSAGVFVHNCGMVAVRTSLEAAALPDSLAELRIAIEVAVPHGGPGIKGSWKEQGYRRPAEVATALKTAHGSKPMTERLDAILEKHPKIGEKTVGVADQLGTLGGGNHFIEICLDEEDRVWVMLHSGSRGIGNQIGRYFIEKAKEHIAERDIRLVDKELAWLDANKPIFDDYIEALRWAQDYAALNRKMMLLQVVGAMRKHLPDFELSQARAINCHHNYVSKETHFGEDLWITRKGAVRAGKDELGIIPGSMGARSYIVRGLGNAESYESCSHGAGRVMSRGQAKEKISLAEHAAATAGIECRKDEGVLDESPAAYKPIEAVMAAQADLVEIVHELRQILCVKG
ncbi:MAG: RtcB family protein [Azospirillum sp.]|nr:RtcB family protein [Azospirillum sp.]